MKDGVILETQNLTLKGVNNGLFVDYGSFKVCGGDFVIIKGKNGCGKSTLFKYLSRDSDVYYKVGGGVKFYGADLPDKFIDDFTDAEASALLRSIVYVGQEDEFETGATAYYSVYVPAARAIKADKRLSPAEKRKKLEETDGIIKEYFNKYLRDGFKCTERQFAHKRVRKYSGGQQKMLHVLSGIIKARVCGVELVMLDEPLNNLDGQNKAILNGVFSDLINEKTAVMIITHCQVFDCINKVLTIVQDGDNAGRAELKECALKAHSGCLEEYRK